MELTIIGQIEVVYSPLQGVKKNNESWVRTEFIVNNIQGTPKGQYSFVAWEDISHLKKGLWFEITFEISCVMLGHKHHTLLIVKEMVELEVNFSI